MAKKIEDKKPQALRFNKGKPDWTLIHYPSLKPMIDVLAYGEFKYSTFSNKKTGEIKTGADISREDAEANYNLVTSGRDNWMEGFSVKELWKSKMRHTVAILAGEEVDSESGLPHIGHLMCNDLFISYYTQTEDGKKKELSKIVI